MVTVFFVVLQLILLRISFSLRGYPSFRYSISHMLQSSLHKSGNSFVAVFSNKHCNANNRLPVVKTPCHISEKCGGCQLQRLTYSDQLAMKKKLVEDAFDLHPNLAATAAKAIVGDVLPAESNLNYCNRAQFAIQKGVDGKGIVGLFETKTNKVVDTTQADQLSTCTVSKIPALAAAVDL